MTNHRCHCKRPATWTLRVVPAREVVLTEGHIPEYILGAMSVDAWAACDKHLADAANGLVERNDMEGAVLVMRQEGND